MYNSENRDSRPHERVREKSHPHHSKSSSRYRHGSTGRDLAADTAGGNRSETLMVQRDISTTPREKPAPQKAPVSEYFTFDRKGDSQNVLYGQNDRKFFRYRSAGFGRVLGLSSKFKLSRDSGYVEELEVDPASRGRRHGKTLASTKIDESKVSETIRAETASGAVDAVVLQKDYLSLDGRKKRRRTSKAEIAGFDVNPLSEIISGQVETEKQSHKGLSTSGSSSEEERESTGNAFELFKNDVQRQRLLDIESQIRQQPSNVDAWLELVDHQKSLTSSSSTMSDLRIGIFERALGQVQSSQARETLALGLLLEGSKVWDARRMTARWESILRETDSTALLIEYLNHQQTDSHTFSVDKCLNVHLDLLRRESSRNTETRDEVCVYLLLRAAIFLRQAGFIERAVAILQAMLEWTLFDQPLRLPDASPEMTAFENFWESELPRFGEEGSTGWRSQETLDPEPKPFKLGVVSDQARDRFQKWATEEQQLASQAQMPARFLDENPGDDPYRVVLFADIKDFLFRMHSPLGQILLVNSFLLFCGMAPLPSCSAAIRQWAVDPFIRSFKADITQETTGGSDSPTSSFSNFAVDTTTLFADKTKWSSPWHDLEDRQIDRRWVQRSLHQLVTLFPANQELSEYAVAFELAFSPQTARKYTKSLLKTRSESLRLYNTFALVESRLGKYEAAEKVWSTALSLSSTLAHSERNNIALLWKSWVWSLIEQGDFTKALGVLTYIPDGRVEIERLPASSNTPVILETTARLRIQRHLEAELQRAIVSGNFDSTIHWTDLLAVLRYLTSHSLENINTTYQSTLTTLSHICDVPPHIPELLHQSLARLLHLHATNQTSRPLEITTLLAPSLSQFPTNTILLTLRHCHAYSFDRLRSILSTLASSPPTPNPVFASHAIQIELVRSISSGRTVHSVRAAFHRALLSSGDSEAPAPLQKNSGMWVSYLTWESSQQMPDTKKIERFFHRALHACPWSKEVYLFGLRSMEGLGRGQEVYESMLERGVRVYREMVA